jgi:predicted methyltransferase
VTALNMHHSNEQRAVPYLKSILAALKPGGRAVVIDHVGLPTIDNSMLHRMPVANAKAWIEAAGFEIVEESNILRTAADDHTRAVFDPVLARNSDRFLFLVHKP